MDSSSRILRFLASVPPFSALNPSQLKALYGFTALKVLAKGDAAAIAGAAVEELGIVVSGRIGAPGAGPQREYGQGGALAAEAFFTQAPAPETLVALRETVLLTLGWDDLTAAFHAHPGLLAACFARIGKGNAAAFASPPEKPARLLLCPAGAKGRFDTGAKDALISALESLAEVRILRRDSFGSLALDTPDTAHWLQAQELEFDVTVILADGSDAGYAMEAIEEADEILFMAGGGQHALSPLEEHALQRRGKDRCRLILAKGKGLTLKNAAEWIATRPYRSTQFLDFASPAETALMASALLGRGHAIAAASAGVYAAAILGALQAFEANGAPAACLTAAGSAIMPAGLLACGASLAETEALFRDLANPGLWKRSARSDAGLFEAPAIDGLLASALPPCDIGLAGRPFAAVSVSLSENAAKAHRNGPLHGAVRAGLAPPGILPPLILEDGDILVSGESEIEAIVDAARHLSASQLVLLYPDVPAPGPSGMSYRQLAGGPSFRLTPFQSQATPDKRVRLETVLGSLSRTSLRRLPALPGVQSFAIPIPEGVSPMDWADWESLRDEAFEWTSAEIEARALAQA
jgi:NTE family protein